MVAVADIMMPAGWRWTSDPNVVNDRGSSIPAATGTDRRSKCAKVVNIAGRNTGLLWFEKQNSLRRINAPTPISKK